MAKLTLSEAARACNVARTTIQRTVKTGRPNPAKTSFPPVGTGSVSKVEMTTLIALICKVLFPSISTFETPPFFLYAGDSFFQFLFSGEADLEHFDAHTRTR